MRAFESEYLDYMRTAHPEILQEIKETQALSDELIERLRDATSGFKAGSQWASSARTATAVAA